MPEFSIESDDKVLTLALPTVRELVPVLNARRLDGATERAMAEFAQQGSSANTAKSYAAALRYWAAWYYLRFGEPLRMPLPVPAVLQFIADHAVRRGPDGESLVHELAPAIDAVLVAKGFKARPGALALATIRHRLAVLSKAHQLRAAKEADRNGASVTRENNPCQHVHVRDLMTAVRKVHAQLPQTQVRKPNALSREPLEEVLATCDDSLRGKRDRALLLFAWASGGRRRSEIAAADLAFLTRKGNEFRYRLLHTKSNQQGVDDGTVDKPIRGRAAQALREWLAVLRAAGIDSGPLFRHIERGGHVGRRGLAPSGVAKIVKDRCTLASLGGRFSAHSLRSGFLTEAGRREIPLKEAMAMSGHNTVRVALSYMQVGDMERSRASDMLED